MSDSIVWASTLDGSFGTCDVRDLIVVRRAEMTTEELDAFWNADGDEVAIIENAHRRIAGEVAS